jgi:hypothetical protein
MIARLWYIKDTPSGLARIYSRLPKSRHPTEADEVCIPVSLIDHSRKYPAVCNEWPEHHVTVPDWLGQKEKL